MISRKRFRLAATTAAALLVLSGCSSNGAAPDTTDASAGDSVSAGAPVSGGTLNVVEAAQPTGFDPVQIFSPTATPITYTGLYGQLLVPDGTSGNYECSLCDTFETKDQGATWTVTTRSGLTFSDGTPFDAEALKYNWDRMKDPANGSASAGVAGQIDHIEIVDSTTAKLVMVTPDPSFKNVLPGWALQFIASPTALAKGQEAFNKNPIGAGPFLLDSWVPNGQLTLKKNPDYFESPKPYLDKLNIQGVTDNTQRLNSLISGGSDFILNSDASVFAEAKSAGFAEHVYTFSAGIGFMLNTSKPPFDNVVARHALAAALDLNALSDAATGGYPSVPVTLFDKSSPYFQDIPLQKYDAAEAQKLFDQLAADGTPLSFQLTMFPGTDTIFDALQAQLKQYKNVTISADNRDASQVGVVSSGEYEATVSSLAFSDPCSLLAKLSNGGTNKGNWSQINDADLNAALLAGCNATDEESANAQWKIVQQRLADLDPFLLFFSYINGALSIDKLQGADMFGYTTPAAADLWLQQ